MLRAVVGARVSVVKGAEKVSHLVQKEAGQRYADRSGWEVVGYFQDLDVSAEVRPFDRPDLGPWLGEKASLWDAMIFSKVDRVFRSAKDCADVAHWAEANRKILVFSDDGIVLNFRDEGKDSMSAMMSKVFLMLASLFAEMELKRTRDRVLGAHRFLRKTVRWPGGYAPYGYEVVDHPEGGKTLSLEPQTAGVAREMAEWYIAGWSFREIAGELNRRNEPTNLVRHLRAQGKTETSKGKSVDGIEWATSVVADLLRTPSLRGYKLHRGKETRGADGLPIRIAEPVFDRELWARLEPALAARSTKKTRTFSTSALLGVAFCDACNGPLYPKNAPKKSSGKVYSYYHCPSGSAKGRANCGTSQPSQQLEDLIEETFIAKVGDKHVPVRRYIPGEDHSEDLAVVKRAIKGLREEKDEGLIVGREDEDEWKERMRALLQRREELDALPQRPAQWVLENSDETYATAWQARDTAGRRQLLLDSGIRLVVKPGPALQAQVEVPEDLAARLRDAVTRSGSTTASGGEPPSAQVENTVTSG
ncbi:site-specific DNA recombinase [Kitasatospora sp. MAA4]|uniref:recombinase family protein n=1 Tax=Kitasatospora sp. MAA4 TaxID=3035093 RepID=UPI002476FD4F|nr:recombinase family protein [Kitasatospora sp. MAA4]MDH6130950.1 site-specific DNA recombinase [Kitasatospora sp. MAA4]